MTFIEAALVVLRSSPEPLTVGEITKRALGMDLVRSTGRTPSATMTSALYMDATTEVPRVRKVYQSGTHRAKRGSVRWTLAER